MAEPTTWTELKANVADWLNRDDLTTQIPEFIGYAERRFNRVLRVPEMEDVVSSAVSSGTFTLPTNFLQARSVYLDTNPKVTLEVLAISDLRDLYASTATGKPQHYAIQSGSEIVLGPEPDDEYTVVLNYYEKIPALGASQATNWLLTAHPDLYMAGALAEAFAFLRDAEGVGVYEQKLAGRVAELNSQARMKHHGGPLIRRGRVANVSRHFNA